MDKYGVVTEETKTKTAADRKLCHHCGTSLDTEANVPKCRACGTKPFEKEETHAKKTK